MKDNLVELSEGPLFILFNEPVKVAKDAQDVHAVTLSKLI